MTLGREPEAREQLAVARPAGIAGARRRSFVLQFRPYQFWKRLARSGTSKEYRRELLTTALEHADDADEADALKNLLRETE